MRMAFKLRIFSFLLSALLFNPDSRIAGSDMTDTLRFEILLSDQMMKAAKINDKLLNNLEVTPGRYILLSSDNQFYLLGWGGIQPLGNKTSGKINSYAFTADKLLMVSSANELCGMDNDGNLSTIFNLPSSDMGVVSGKYAMYVYEKSTAGTGSVFIVTHGGQHARLFGIPAPINSVVEYENSLLLASGNAIFRYRIKDKDLRLFAALPDDQVIRSIAIDTSQNRVYFSTDNAIYALKNSTASIISDQIGGLIRFFNGGLIAFNPDKNFIVRILGIEDDLASRKPSFEDNTGVKLNNSAVITLVKAKVRDEEIINLIRNYPGNYNTSVDSMIYLSGQNVSSEVILAMRNAARINKSTASAPASAKISNSPGETKTQPETRTNETGKALPNRFFIITGSYPNQAEAEQAVAVLKGKGYPDASVVGTNSAGSFRISCKSYPSGEEAMKDLPDVKKSLNSSAWIFEKK